MTAKQKHQIKFSGVQYLVQLEVSNGLRVNGLDTWRLSDVSGSIVLTLPQQMAPFAKVGDQILIPLSMIRGDVVSTSPILSVVE